MFNSSGALFIWSVNFVTRRSISLRLKFMARQMSASFQKVSFSFRCLGIFFYHFKKNKRGKIDSHRAMLRIEIYVLDEKKTGKKKLFN